MDAQNTLPQTLTKATDSTVKSLVDTFSVARVRRFARRISRISRPNLQRFGPDLPENCDAGLITKPLDVAIHHEISGCIGQPQATS